MRRTEKKRPPSSPILFGRLTHGKRLEGTTPEGRTYSYWDWDRDPQALSKLLDTAQSQMNVDYDFSKVDLDKFSGNPTEIPVLYITGHEGQPFSNDQRKKIREYVLGGGLLLSDACCGAENFVGWFRQEMKFIFPDSVHDIVNLLGSVEPVINNQS